MLVQIVAFFCALSLVAQASAAPSLEEQKDNEHELLLAHARFEIASGNEKAAIPILRDYVAAVPGDLEAEFDLARVLANTGRYAESVRHYENVLASPPNPADGSLAAHSDLRASAIAGIGDVLAWSGRTVEARRKYDEALGLSPGLPEIVEARDRLDEASASAVKADHERFHDSSRLEWNRSTVAFDAGEARSAAIFVTLTRDQVSLPRDPLNDDGGDQSGDGTGGAAARSLTGGMARLGGRRALGKGMTAKLEIGASWFEGDVVRGTSGVSLAQQTMRGLSWGIQHSYGVRGYELKSIEAQGLTGHETAIDAYQVLPARVAAWGQLRAGFLSDGNGYRGGALGLTRPLALGLDARAAASALDYASSSESYYAPAEEWSAAVGMGWAAGEERRGIARASFLAGRGGNRDESGADLSFDLELGYRLLGPLALEGRYSYAQSVRTSAYISRLAAAGIRLNL